MNSLLTFLPCALAFLFLLAHNATASSALNAKFDQANIAFQQADYPQAIALYQELLAEKQSAHLHFNLANAYFQNNQLGMAILHFNRALIIEPGNPDYEANLSLAERAAETTLPDYSWEMKLAKNLHVNTWTVLGVCSFWAAIALLVLPRFFAWQGIFPWACFCVAVVTGLFSCLGLAGYHHLAQEGIVLSADAPLKVAPTGNSPPAAYLASGEIAFVDKEHSPYFLIKTVRGQTGWISQEHFGKIWD